MVPALAAGLRQSRGNWRAFPRVEGVIEETDMTEQPNKPGGDFRDDGKVRDAGDEQAVKNQGQVKPEDYPDPNSGDMATGEMKD
jgi:hypothetical protein